MRDTSCSGISIVGTLSIMKCEDAQLRALFATDRGGRALMTPVAFGKSRCGCVLGPSGLQEMAALLGGAGVHWR